MFCNPPENRNELAAFNCKCGWREQQQQEFSNQEKVTLTQKSDSLLFVEAPGSNKIIFLCLFHDGFLTYDEHNGESKNLYLYLETWCLQLMFSVCNIILFNSITE